jgi:hypothetical protein
MNTRKYSHLCHYHPLRLAEEAAHARSRFWHETGEVLLAFAILGAAPFLIIAERIWRDMRKPKEDCAPTVRVSQ